MTREVQLFVVIDHDEPRLIATGELRDSHATEPYEIAELLRQTADDIDHNLTLKWEVFGSGNVVRVPTTG